MTGSDRAPYFPFYVQDFLHSCRRSAMTAEEIGAYMIVLCKQWEDGGPVTNDARMLSAYSGWDIRTVRRLTDRLIALKKIDAADGKISQSRMQDEIGKYTARVKAAREREERKKAKSSAGDPGEVQPDVPEKSDDKASGLPGELSENDNENNGSKTTGGSTKTALPDPYPEPDREEKKDMPTEVVGTDAGDEDPKPKTVKAYTAAFEAFWQAFPIKDGKWAAFDKSWRKLSAEDRERATAGAKLFADRVEREKIEKPKWAQGWLSDRRWEDEFRRVEAAPDAEARRPWWQKPELVASLSEADWDRLIDKHANGTWPVDKLGWWPAHPKHVVPDSVIARRGLLERYDRNGIAKGGKVHG